MINIFTALFIFVWIIALFVYGRIGMDLYNVSYTKMVELEDEKRLVADFNYNNLTNILNIVLFPTFLLLLMYFSLEDEYNHFTKGKPNRIIKWLFDKKE